jgi:hypothetical protein
MHESRSLKIGMSLRRDVVATDEAIGTSTYLASRPWVAMVAEVGWMETATMPFACG